MDALFYTLLSVFEYLFIDFDNITYFACNFDHVGRIILI